MSWVDYVQAAGYLYSAISGYSQGKAQSKLDAANALANSQAIAEAGRMNARSYLMMGAINAQLGMAGAAAENTRLRAINEENAKVRSFMGDYEGMLLDNEALLVMGAADVDLKQLGRRHAEALGDIIVDQASSGAIINQDTPGDVIESVQHQQEMEKFVIRRGADVQIAKLKDAAAMSRYTGNQEANNILFEGRLFEQSNIVNAALKGYGLNAQANIDASSVLYNSTVQASQTYTTGMQHSNQSSYAGTSAFWNGIFGAGSSLASSYVDSKKEKDGGSLLSESNS